jgi:hypothetical protein
LQRDIVHAVSTCTPNGASRHRRDFLSRHLPASVGVSSCGRPASIGRRSSFDQPIQELS